MRTQPALLPADLEPTEPIRPRDPAILRVKHLISKQLPSPFADRDVPVKAAAVPRVDVTRVLQRETAGADVPGRFARVGAGLDRVAVA